MTFESSGLEAMVVAARGGGMAKFTGEIQPAHADKLKAFVQGLPEHDKAELKATARLSTALLELEDQRRFVEEGLRTSDSVPVELICKSYIGCINRHRKALDALQNGQSNRVVANLLEEQALANQRSILQNEDQFKELTYEYGSTTDFITAERKKLNLSVLGRLNTLSVMDFDNRMIIAEIRRRKPELFTGQNGEGGLKKDATSQQWFFQMRNDIEHMRGRRSAREITEEVLRFGGNDNEKYHVLNYAKKKGASDWREQSTLCARTIDQNRAENADLDKTITDLGFKPQVAERETYAAKQLIEQSADYKARYNLILGLYKNSGRSTGVHLMNSYLYMEDQQRKITDNIVLIEQAGDQNPALRGSLRRELSRLNIMINDVQEVFEIHKAVQNWPLQSRDMRLKEYADMPLTLRSQFEQQVPQISPPQTPDLSQLKIVTAGVSAVGGRERNEDGMGLQHQQPTLAPGEILDAANNRGIMKN